MTHAPAGGYADFMTMPRLGWAFNLLLHSASINAQPSAAAADGSFPCLIFSHGLGANRTT